MDSLTPPRPAPRVGDPAPKDALIVEFQRKIFEKLLDATRNNPLLYYKDSRTTRFGISDIGSRFVSDFVDGRTLRAEDFGPADDAARATIQKRLTAIRAKAREYEEERGLRTLLLAAGMVTWKSEDGGRDPLAPLFLFPAEISDDPQARGSLIIRRAEAGDAVVNRALRLRATAPRAFADALGLAFEDGTVESLADAYARVQELASRVPGLTVLPTCAFGIFNFGAMAMIEDLDGAHNVLAANPLIRALAGDETAQAELLGAREGAVELAELDDIPPPQEPFVLDADPWQSQAIHTLVQRDVTAAIIDGPPGTGKSQTIANLIAAIIASGKSVLFVAEKRAALEVVQHRLASVGLGHLILDLHAADTKRARVYASLRASRDMVGQSLPPDASRDAPFLADRKRLNDHVRSMHTLRPACERSAFQLLSARAALGPVTVQTRVPYSAARKISASQLETLCEKLHDASRDSDLFLSKSGVPWTASTLSSDEVATAVDALARVADEGLEPLSTFLQRVGIECIELEQARAAASELVELRKSLEVIDPAVLMIDAGMISLGLSTLRSPFAKILGWLSPMRRAAAAKLKAMRRSQASDAAIIRAIELWQKSADAFRDHAADIDGLPESLLTAFGALTEDLAMCERLIGLRLPEDVAGALRTLREHAASSQTAYRAAHLRKLRKTLATAGLTPLIDELRERSIDPALWAKSLESLWTDAHLESLRPELAAFNGRVHDGIVSRFCSLEEQLREVAAARVRRAAAERYVRATTASRVEESTLATQLAKSRPRKPLRDLVRETPSVLSALVPCIMASPLSVSQFLPAAPLFDYVLFDEASQVTPGNAVSAIMRGRRVVLAGDERQLPPTDFFGSGGKDDDEDDDESAVDGVESVLAAMRPFAKDLGLRVHYRSRDEHLIAFSNHWLYGGELITFPGCGVDGRGVSHVLASPGGEIDESSSGPEVRSVVELIFRHAAERPNESLGVITLGLPHKLRIDAAIASTRREHPELDEFFSDERTERFFVKNLERVQGDERDAIILTFGYGRTKTGAVSHNFGPINQRGGERRLNVAVTRAKSRLTVVSSFRSLDLDRSRLTSDGARLLAKYLAYAESHGADLGRDGSAPDVPLNAFEGEIKSVLEQRIGLTCVPQYGVGQFRLDLAVQHPEEPGRFVLAIECDGASYHSTPTARMRDRLRQNILEGLGWRFCRIWSTDWFNDRDREIERVRSAYNEALSGAQRGFPSDAGDVRHSTAASVAASDGTVRRAGPCPIRVPGRPINSYSDRELQDALKWIESDGRLRSDADLVNELKVICEYGRLGKVIAARFESAIRTYREATR